jgi:RHH-type proline utilization regulon transcriptional repressor/proline dehydrogenase/delta 1-pyrroline-5-carboxylate dehydrogenase
VQLSEIFAAESVVRQDKKGEILLSCSAEIPFSAAGTRLTHGINTKARRMRSGSSYVNRSMIGAVVGVQPFGGEALSGTDPKAGGPRYLYRFATERTVSTDTTAAGSNATLLSMQEEG